MTKCGQTGRVCPSMFCLVDATKVYQILSFAMFYKESGAGVPRNTEISFRNGKRLRNSLYVNTFILWFQLVSN